MKKKTLIRWFIIILKYEHIILADKDETMCRRIIYEYFILNLFDYFNFLNLFNYLCFNKILANNSVNECFIFHLK